MIFDDISKVLPRYELKEIIGSGGMGVVYKGWDKQAKRTVAVKIIRASDIHDKKTRERFKKEASIITSLEHSNIVKLYDFGEKGDILYYSMNYINGVSIDKYVFENKLSVKQILKLIINICDIFDYIHRHGIVHRDIKPSNILMDSNGVPHILDFGIAKDYSENGLTQTGELIGTIRYISPEQIENKNVDQQTDVYSISVLLYYLLSKEFPHDGTISVNLMMKILSDAPIPLKSRGRFPHALEQICMEGLQKNRIHRTESVSELAENLHLFLQKKYRAKIILRKKPILYISTILLFIILSIPVFLDKMPLSKANIVTNPIIEIQNLINLTLYEDANNKINNIIKDSELCNQETKRTLKKMQMQIWRGQHLYNKIIFCPEQEEDNETSLLRAIAHYYLNSPEKTINKYLNMADSEVSLVTEEVQFYKISVFYRFQRYPAIINLFKTININDFKNKNQVNTIYLYLAIAYLNRYKSSLNKTDYDNVHSYLKKVAISNDDILLFESWAEYYAFPGEYNNFVLSEKYLQKCCALRHNESKYWTKLGQVQLQLKKISNAYDSFYTAITVAEGASYLGALEELVKFSLYDPKLNEEIFWLTMNVFLQREHRREPDLIEEDISNIRKIYEFSYITYKKATNFPLDKKQQKNNLDTFFLILAQGNNSNQKKAIEAIRIAAHSTDIEPLLKTFLQSKTINDVQKKNLENLKKSLLEDIKKQHKNLQYYRLANHYLFDDFETKKELLKDIDSVYEILESPNEDVLLRYLAAKALISLNQYERLLENLETCKDNSLLVSILAALQEAKMSFDIEHLLQYNLSMATRYETILYLRALPLRDKMTSLLVQQFDPNKKSIDLDKLIDKVIPLLEQECPIIKTCAAAMIWRFVNIKDPICTKAQSILHEMLDSKNFAIQKYTHFHYWKSPNFTLHSTEKDIFLYQNIFKKYSPEIQMFALDFYGLGRIQSFFEPLLLELIDGQNKQVSLKAALLITRINPDNEKFKMLMYTNKLNLGVRAIAVASSGSSVIKRRNQDVFANLQNTIKYTDFVFESNIYEDEYKAFIYNLFALLGIQYEKALRHDINPNLKANILSSFCMENIVPENIRKFLSFFPNRASSDKMIEYIKQSHQNIKELTPQLQEAVYTSSFFLGTEEQRYSLYNKALSSSDQIFKSAIARGFYRVLYKDLTDQIGTYEREMGASPFQYHFYLYFLKSISTNALKREKYLAFLTKAIQLEPNEEIKAQYYFERAILYRLAGNYSQALFDIQKALLIKDQKKFGMFYIMEVAHILYLNNPNKQNALQYSEMIENYLPFTENLYQVVQIEEFNNDLDNKDLKIKILYRKLFLCLSLDVVDDNTEFLLGYKIPPQTTWHYEIAEKIHRDLSLNSTIPILQKLHQNTCGLIMKIKTK